MEHDIIKLLERQKGRDFFEAWKEIDAEAARADRQAKAKDKNVSSSARAYRASLGRVLFWFHHGARPDGITDSEWYALGVLAHDFVKRGMLNPEALIWFNSTGVDHKATG